MPIERLPHHVGTGRSLGNSDPTIERKKLDSEERIELRRRIFVTFIWLLVWFGLFRGMTARSSSASWELWWMEME